jgi:hypothetical protein
MIQLARELRHGELKGTQYSEKRLDSIVAKMINDADPRRSLVEALRGEKDTNRFTVEIPEKNYVAGVNAWLETLTREGWKNTQLKNFWCNPEDYRGINSIWTRDLTLGAPPSTVSAPIEVQFHTARSLDAKQTSHGLYDGIKAPKAKIDAGQPLTAEEKKAYDDLNGRLKAVFAAVPIPDGARGSRPSDGHRTPARRHPADHRGACRRGRLTHVIARRSL